jgi:hypothetical protein
MLQAEARGTLSALATRKSKKYGRRALRTQVLIEILNELRRTNERLEQTNERLEQTNERLSSLERRQTEMEARLATELVAVARAVTDVRDLLREDRRLAPVVDDHL